MKKTIAQNMCQLMEETNTEIVWYGEIQILEECARRSGIQGVHPKIRTQKILNALDDSELFIKGYIRADFSGQQRTYRSFRLKD